MVIVSRQVVEFLDAHRPLCSYAIVAGSSSCDVATSGFVSSGTRDVFTLDPTMRGMFGLPLAVEPELARLRRWRDDLYRRHRGRRVVPVDTKEHQLSCEPPASTRWNSRATRSAIAFGEPHSKRLT